MYKEREVSREEFSASLGGKRSRSAHVPELKKKWNQDRRCGGRGTLGAALGSKMTKSLVRTSSRMRNIKRKSGMFRQRDKKVLGVKIYFGWDN